MGKKRLEGGELFEGDYGCVVYPGLTEHIDTNRIVTKVFKNPGEKVKEERANEIIQNFQNDFIVKKIDDSVNINKNTEITNCKINTGQITSDYVSKNSISYEYLGKTFDKIFSKSDDETKEYIKALIDLCFKVIVMNSKGYSHGDVASRNISFKDGKCYLIDIGSFQYNPGTLNYTDVTGILKVIQSFPNIQNIITDEDDKILLNYFSQRIRPNELESVKEFLEKIKRYSEFTIIPISAGRKRSYKKRSHKRKTHRRKR